MLHSIPPVNRQRGLSALSSMRAATLSRHVFVGSQQYIRPIPVQKHRLKIVPPNPVIRQQREQMYHRLRELAMQMEQMIAGAEDSAEITFWQKALARLREK